MKGGMEWAWASPCAGGCSQLGEIERPGWRRATPQECAMKPSEAEFDGTCAAHIFDPQHDHCDPGNELVCEENGSWQELVLVCTGEDGGGGDGIAACGGVDAGWAVMKGGMEWAWASPCSGGCGEIARPGWRRATPEECAMKPSEDEFDGTCAAHIFDPQHDHCDPGNELVCVENGSWQELVLVCTGEDAPNP